MNNPKLEGSNLIDCIPQTGKCPNNCLGCYYNKGFYRSLYTPLIPSLNEVEGKIVRVNSGHDSNIQKDLVLKATECYKDKFYNTSIPNFDFPAPVIYTCNPGKGNRDLDYATILSTKMLENIMAIRVRTVPWNISLALALNRVYNYRNLIPIPIILTFMRFPMTYSIPNVYRDLYEYRAHIINSYFCLKSHYIKAFEESPTPNIYLCGTSKSNLCKDCGNCETFYRRFKNK